MSEPEKPEVPAKPKREPAALSSEYHKAHKQLMLWSTILLIWELIGVDLSKAKDAGGNIGPLVTALKSPQAVPWALTGLVVYFLFKCSVEWAQCHVDRRKIRFARVDFLSAWVVSLAAIALYIGQTISEIQFANAVQDSGRLTSVLFGFITGAGVVGLIQSFSLWIEMRSRMVAMVALMSLLMIPLGAFVLILFGRNWGFGLLGFTIMPLLAIVFGFRLFRRHLSQIFTFAQELTRLPK